MHCADKCSAFPFLHAWYEGDLGLLLVGIYYPPGSLKAKLCMEGRGRLYAYCEEHGVPHKRLGKLLVATEEEEVGPAACLKSSQQRIKQSFLP